MLESNLLAAATLILSLFRNSYNRHCIQQVGNMTLMFYFIKNWKESHLLGQNPLPVSTVCSTSSHGAEQELVDLDDLLHTARPDVHPASGSGVHSKQDSSLQYVLIFSLNS